MQWLQWFTWIPTQYCQLSAFPYNDIRRKNIELHVPHSVYFRCISQHHTYSEERHCNRIPATIASVPTKNHTDHRNLVPSCSRNPYISDAENQPLRDLGAKSIKWFWPTLLTHFKCQIRLPKYWGRGKSEALLILTIISDCSNRQIAIETVMNRGIFRILVYAESFL